MAAQGAVHVPELRATVASMGLFSGIPIVAGLIERDHYLA